jgi:hypothetical protein
MFKPVVPYISDLVAHLLFFKDHMRTVHAHHGKFHVHGEVAEAAKNDQPAKSTNNGKNDTPGNEHIIIESNEFSAQQISINFPAPFPFPAKHVSIDHDFPPPRM